MRTPLRCCDEVDVALLETWDFTNTQMGLKNEIMRTMLRRSDGVDIALLKTWDFTHTHKEIDKHKMMRTPLRCCDEADIELSHTHKMGFINAKWDWWTQNESDKHKTRVTNTMRLIKKMRLMNTNMRVINTMRLMNTKWDWWTQHEIDEHNEIDKQDGSGEKKWDW